MLTMDVFNADIFSAISLSAAVDKYGYVPQCLTHLPGLFEPAPVMTKGIFIETRATGPALVYPDLAARHAAVAKRPGSARRARL